MTTPAQLSFTAIDANASGAYVSRCQGWYPNRMQCVRASEFIATDTTQDPPKAVGGYCAAHKAHLEAGLLEVPIRNTPGTGTVLPEQFQIKTAQGETVKVEVDPPAEIANGAS